MKFDIFDFVNANDKIKYCKLVNMTDIDWYILSRKLKLSEEFIREYKDKLSYIERDQKLSEDFIRKYYFDSFDKSKWYDINIFQALSDEFIKEIPFRLDFKRPNISYSYLIDLFGWARNKYNHYDTQQYKEFIKYFKLEYGDKTITWNEFVTTLPFKYNEFIEDVAVYIGFREKS